MDFIQIKPNSPRANIVMEDGTKMSMGKPLVRNAKLAGIAEPVILSQTIAQRLEKVALSVNQAGIRLKRAIAFANRALMDSGKNFLNPFHVWGARQDSTKTREAPSVRALIARPVFLTLAMMEPLIPSRR